MIRARQKAKKQGEYLYIANIYAKMRSTIPSEERQRVTRQSNQQTDDVIFTQRIMRWYAKQLLRPTVKAFVLVVFAGLTAWTVWRTTLLKQAFNVEDYVPEDSYTKTFFSSRRSPKMRACCLAGAESLTISHFFASQLPSGSLFKHQDATHFILPQRQPVRPLGSGRDEGIHCRNVELATNTTLARLLLGSRSSCFHDR